MGQFIKIAALTLLLAAICVGAVFLLFSDGRLRYLRSIDQIELTESGILCGNLAFCDAPEQRLVYEFENEQILTLKELYPLARIAGEGPEWERALRLMNEYAPRLSHKSDFANTPAQSAEELLSYSLDKKNQGVNCRAKAQILNEMCLSLGIYARKVWLMPYSIYDKDCHVVNEVWDSTLQKWIMLDITQNSYWVDETRTPLSVLEIREKLALREFCTPIRADDKRDDLQKIKNELSGNFLYIAKNMVYLEYCAKYTAGESDRYYVLCPQAMQESLDQRLNGAPVDWISRSSIERSPLA